MAAGQWDPQRFLGSLRREIDRVFEEFFASRSGHHSHHRRRREGEREEVEPAVDVVETDEAVVVTALVPGVAKDNLTVEVTAEELTLKGEVKEEEGEKTKHYHRQEIGSGAFTRTVRLPVAVESEKAVATLKDGVLEVTVPKRAPGTGRPVKVEVS
jgi:HSP20 family protein